MENEEKFRSAGVYYGAGASEAQLCVGHHVVVVGGGNSGAQAALHFAKRSPRVTLVARRRSQGSVSMYLIDRIRSAPNVEVLTNTEVTALEGDKILNAVAVMNRKTGETRRIETHWVFVCIGGSPRTEWAKETGVVRDQAGTW